MIPASLYGLLMPVSFVIAMTILAYVCFGITPSDLLHIVQTIRAANG